MTSVPVNEQVQAAQAVAVSMLDDVSALTVAGELSVILASGASDRDRERMLPHREICELAQTGLLAVTVPTEFGGADASPATVAEIFRLLGRADPNLAQVAHGHFVNVHLLKVAGTPEQQRLFFAEVMAGAVLGTAQMDLHTDSQGKTTAADPVVVPTRLTRDGPGVFRLNGIKTRATGALFAKWIPTLARLDDGTTDGGEELVAFVPREAEGVTVVDESDDIGLRTAASGRVEFVNVHVPSQYIVRRGKAISGTHAVGSFAQLLHAAIEVGLAGEVLSEAADFVRTVARPVHEAHVRNARDDVLLVQRFGELTVEVRAAEAALIVASRSIAESIHTPSTATVTEAAVAVATVKVLAERAALAVTSAVFEVGGHASAARAHNLDRHWRNARTHSLDDPIRWKYHHLGNYTLSGISPPRHRQM